jgi:hypothetical protein
MIEPPLTFFGYLTKYYGRVEEIQVTINYCFPSCDKCGLQVAHKIYGFAQTINTANYVYFLAYQELFALRNSPSSDPPRRPLDAIVTRQSIPPCPFLIFFHAAHPRRGIAFAPSRPGPRNSMARLSAMSFRRRLREDGQQQYVQPRLGSLSPL